jgi:signal transduction histidine kinase
MRRSRDKYNEELNHAREDAQRLLKNSEEDAERILRIAREDVERILKNAREDDLEEEFPNSTSTENDLLKKDKLHTIGEMSSRLAHDLQNPLSIIRNTLEVLKIKQPNLDEKTKESYERIDRAAARMSQQIKDVLDYVRTGNLLVENTSLINLLKAVIADIDVPHDIRIILPTEDIPVYGDVKQLETVFSNLILNSIQAITEKGKIMIQASENGEMTVIDIIDNGRGIQKEDLAHIFEPLFTTKRNGTGLGLASCKSIVENHSGTIECSSIVDKGTVFTIKIPKLKSHSKT